MEELRTMTKCQNTSIQIQDVHSSWIRSLPNGSLLEKLIRTPSARPAITKYLERYIGFKDIDISKTNGVLRLIHLSKPVELHEIVLKAGAAQLSKKFSRTISQQEVKLIKKSLGEKLYRFSLHEAPIIFPNIQGVENHVITTNNNPIVDVIDAGYKSLQIALEKTPNNCIYKLPKQWHSEYVSNNKADYLSKSQRAFHMNLIFNLFEIASEAEISIF